MLELVRVRGLEWLCKCHLILSCERDARFFYRENTIQQVTAFEIDEHTAMEWNTIAYSYTTFIENFTFFI